MYAGTAIPYSRGSDDHYGYEKWESNLEAYSVIFSLLNRGVTMPK